MRCVFYLVVASLAFIYGVMAQTLSASRIVALTTATSSSSSTAAASTQVVLVGYNSHEFHPNNLTAKAGDLIVFQFVAQGHTVVQANFEQPCIPRDTYHRDRSTFSSGWYNGSDVLSDNVGHHLICFPYMSPSLTL